AAESAGAPHLAEPEVLRADPGSAPQPVASAEVDAYAWPHNETSTGVMVPVRRPEGATTDQLVLVDATSVAGTAVVDIAETDAYYFAPQKAFASDGGLWLSVLSPAALERAQRLGRDSSRWIPSFLSLTSAIDNSRKNQTLNTPAVATLVLLAEQIEWMLARGGLAWTDERTRTTSGMLQEWAAGREEITPFVTDPTAPSQVVTTLDVDESIDATAITDLPRAHGVADIEPYRKLGRNQLRIATTPSVGQEDTAALIPALDHVLYDTAHARAHLREHSPGRPLPRLSGRPRPGRVRSVPRRDEELAQHPGPLAQGIPLRRRGAVDAGAEPGVPPLPSGEHQLLSLLGERDPHLAPVGRVAGTPHQPGLFEPPQDPGHHRRADVLEVRQRARRRLPRPLEVGEHGELRGGDLL